MVMLPCRCRGVDRSRGFTLVEVLVALLLLAIVVGNIAALSTVAARTVFASRRQSAACWLAVQKIEQIQALMWTSTGVAPGTPQSDSSTNLAVDPPAGSGGGLALSPAGALDRNTPGFVDFTDANGVWVGSGASPPRAAAFIRRWSIEPLGGVFDDTLLIQVFVTTVDAAARVGSGPRTTQPGDVWLVSAKARTSQ